MNTRDKFKKIGLFILAGIGGLALVGGLAMGAMHAFGGGHHGKGHHRGYGHHRGGPGMLMIGAYCPRNLQGAEWVAKKQQRMVKRLDLNNQQTATHDALQKKIASTIKASGICNLFATMRAEQNTAAPFEHMRQRADRMIAMGGLHRSLAGDFEAFYQTLNPDQQSKLNRLMR